MGTKKKKMRYPYKWIYKWMMIPIYKRANFKKNWKLFTWNFILQHEKSFLSQTVARGSWNSSVWRLCGGRLPAMVPQLFSLTLLFCPCLVGNVVSAILNDISFFVATYSLLKTCQSTCFIVVLCKDMYV